MISKLQQCTLELLSSALTGKAPAEPEKEVNISALIRECAEQGVLFLVADALYPVCPEEMDRVTLFYRAAQNQDLEIRILEAQDSVLRLLKVNGFHPLILKGWAAAQYYAAPEKRAFGDVDVLLPKDEFYPALELLLGQGYGYRDRDAKVDHHIALKKDGIDVEPHIAVAGLPESAGPRTYLEDLFAAGLAHPVVRNVQGYEVPFLPDLQNGLSLLLHIRGHLKGGLGLRQIADWMVFVRHHLDDGAYASRWQEVLEKAGLDGLAKTATALCVKYLGLEGDYAWCSDADDKAVDDLMEFVFEQGNFGHKKRNSDVGAKRISGTGGLSGFMRQLYRSGVHHWSVRNKRVNPETRPVLRLFAWFYGFGHYAAELYKKGGLRYLWKSYAEAKRRRRFFAKLGLYD